jgi:hypothetical protein
MRHSSAAEQSVLQGVDPSACASMKCQPQHHCRLILTVSTPLPRTDSKQVSFEQVLYFTSKFTITFHITNIYYANIFTSVQFHRKRKDVTRTGNSQL